MSILTVGVLVVSILTVQVETGSILTVEEESGSILTVELETESILRGNFVLAIVANLSPPSLEARRFKSF